MGSLGIREFNNSLKSSSLNSTSLVSLFYFIYFIFYSKKILKKKMKNKGIKGLHFLEKSIVFRKKEEKN